MMKIKFKSYFLYIIFVLLLMVLSVKSIFRIDLTSDKRYTVSMQTKELMRSVKAPLNITLYLTGDLNSGFQRLKKSTIDMLQELEAYSKGNMTVQFFDVNNAKNDVERNANYLFMQKRGMSPVTVYEKNKDGKSVQKVVFPWIEISYGKRSIPIQLLQNNRMLSGEENLNNSIEDLEFELTDAIRRVTNEKIEKIAFLEGHGELNEYETLDITRKLSRYFQIDRGVIGSNPDVLDEYQAVIIAKPTSVFPEKDKFVLDQYLMKGGKILWLIDGVLLSEEELIVKGLTPVIAQDLNLNDMFFHYGVRINPVLVEDRQSALVPINVAPADEAAQYEPMPWVYSPLLVGAQRHAITKNLSPVRGDYASMIEAVGKETNVNKTILLASSGQSNLLKTPSAIDMNQLPDFTRTDYFKLKYIPVAMLLEGKFSSVFTNRIAPKGIDDNGKISIVSTPTRQIVIADGDIIKNEIQQIGDSIDTLPLGFDRYTNHQFGNAEFITNSVLYLTDMDGWMNLRARTIPLRILNQELVVKQKMFWQIINLLLPLFLLIISGFLVNYIRKRKYT